MAKHYGNFEVVGRLWVGDSQNANSYFFPVNTSGKSEGELLVLVDNGGNLELDFATLDSSFVSYTPSTPSNWPTTPTNVTEALDILITNSGSGSITGDYVSSVNGITGSVNIVGDSIIGVSESGQSITISLTGDILSQNVIYDPTSSPLITAGNVQDAIEQLDLILNSFDVEFGLNEIVFGTGTGISSDSRFRYDNGEIIIERNNDGSFLSINRDGTDGEKIELQYISNNGSIYTTFKGWDGTNVVDKFSQGIAYVDNNSSTAPWNHRWVLSAGSALNNNNNIIEAYDDLSVRLLGDVTVEGNFYVNGDEIIVNTETVLSSSNFIVINNGEPNVSGVTAGYAGIRVDRGPVLPFYEFSFRETDDVFVVGMSGDLQAVATREDTPTNNYYARWNAVETRFDTVSPLTIAQDVSGFFDFGSDTIILSGNGINVSQNGDEWTISVDDYISASEVADLTGSLQTQVNNLSAAIEDFEGESTVIESSGGSILVTQDGNLWNIEVASAPIQYHNDLNGLQGGANNEYYHLSEAQFNDWIGKTEVIDITSNLQNEIDDLQTQIDSLTGFGSSQHGVEDCVVGENIYTINHLETDDYPVASLVVPTSGDFISILGIFDKTPTSFKVVLSSTPPITGYRISWYVSNSDTVANQTTTFTREVVADTTSTIADDVSATMDIVGYKGYNLYKIETSHAAWVRIYVDEDSRIADSGRDELTDPLPGSGVIAEVITTPSNLTALITPAVVGFNNESPPTNIIPISVTNKSGANAAIEVSLTILGIED